MATPRAAVHRDVEQRFRDLEARRPILGGSGSVTIVQDGSGSGDSWFSETLVIDEPGDATKYLAFIPDPAAMVVRWGSLTVPPANWSVSGNQITVVDPDLVFKAGHVLGFWYRHFGAPGEPPPPESGGTLVSFGSTGWRFLQIARGDSSDYSSPTFDDSSWVVDQAPFGDGGDMADDTGGPHVTLWDKTTRMWARRTLTGLVPGQQVDGLLRVDNQVVIYLGGTLVFSGTPNGHQVSFSIPGALITSSTMPIAVRVTDESTSFGCYFDLELSQ